MRYRRLGMVLVGSGIVIMKLTLTHYTIIVLIITTAVSTFEAFYYLSAYSEQKATNNRQTTEIQQLTDTISYQNTHINMLHELDTKRTQELANAKTKLDELSDTLRADIKRVYVKAECPVSETAASSGVDGSRPARLAKDAEQDYVRLLGELETLEAQLLGLRDWAKTECRGNNGKPTP
ncbi:lysis protein [Xenorhabdus thuongxuanensis]|uniref:Peptidase n=1 Tax=Xenorhabdus thuongxuanensis TaxID=1873484 RepID=A0A1Q5TM12_9GAMM|nr:lysis protein [Xenorhabdus thuongxuanensis]OKP01265.1 peptidase [Xenorhabdus thuongxuanensis]